MYSDQVVESSHNMSHMLGSFARPVEFLADPVMNKCLVL